MLTLYETGYKSLYLSLIKQGDRILLHALFFSSSTIQLFSLLLNPQKTPNSLERVLVDSTHFTRLQLYSYIKRYSSGENPLFPLKTIEKKISFNTRLKRSSIFFYNNSILITVVWNCENLSQTSQIVLRVSYQRSK